MNVILEGCDCTGKTVLAKKIGQWIAMHHGATTHFEHEGVPPDNEDLLERYVVKAITYEHCVHDRLHLGERVYGAQYRNNDRLGYIGQHIIDHYMVGSGFGLICCPPWKKVVRTWKGRLEREMVKDEEVLKRIYDHYLTFDPSVWMRIDPFDEADQKKVLNKIRTTISTRIPIELGVGPRHARTLIVGEQSNHRMYDLPFLSTTGSSGYLYSAMISAKFGHNYFITNAFRKDGEARDIRGIIRWLPALQRVIALGGVAGRLLDAQRIPNVNVAHPQFFYRFKHHSQADYTALLRAGLEVYHGDQLHVL